MLGLFEQAADLEYPGLLSGCDSSGLLLAQAYLGQHDTVLSSVELARKRGELPTLGTRNTIGSWGRGLAAVEALVVVGEPDEAAGLYPLVIEAIGTGMLFRPFDGKLLECVAGIAAAAGRRWDLAEAHYEKALDLAVRLPQRLDLPDIRRWYALMLLQRDYAGDRDRARDLLGEAVKEFHAIGMPRHEEMAASQMTKV